MNESSLGSFQAHQLIWELELPQALQSKEIYAWLVNFKAADRFLSALRQILSADELRRADRFLIEEPKRRFMLTRGALRLILSRYTAQDPAKLRFVYSSSGKPSLSCASGLGERLRFNVSHSGELGLIAVTCRMEIGVDIELVQGGRDLLELGRRFFSHPEQSVLNQASPADLARVFYRVWTRKEAVLKASGQGITSGLCEPDVSAAALQADPKHELPATLGAQRWLVSDLCPRPGYEAALAVEHE